jgi:hypothetical protein
MAAKKNTEGMAFIVESLKKSKSATYADIKAAAGKKGLTVWPIMFGRAQLLLGHVKGAKRGTGRYAQANVAKKAGTAMPAPKRGPGRPRKYAPATNGIAGLDSVLSAVRNSHVELGRFRVALERISSMVSEALG